MYNQIEADILIWLEEQNQSKNQSQWKKEITHFHAKSRLIGWFCCEIQKMLFKNIMLQSTEGILGHKQSFPYIPF